MSVVETKKPPLNQRLSFWLIVLLIVGLLGEYRQYNVLKANHRARPPQLVVVAPATTQDMPIYISALGGVTPVSTITVKTQINGQLFQVFFREGQMVKKGDLLALIDPRPYQAQLVQYEGQLEHDQALLDNANVDLKRYQMLWKQNSVAKQILDTQVSLVHQYEGSVKVDQGLIATTKLNLVYCHIISPVDGRIGLRLVDPGNFVQTSDTTGLFVVDALNPITVIFPVPEDNIPDLIQAVYSGQTMAVTAYNRDFTQLLSTGELLTMDNQVDPTTGTVKLRAQFQNSDNHLFPNQFVNVKILVRTELNDIVVPTAAVQYGSHGAYVYVLNQPKKTVSIHLVTTGVVLGSNTSIKNGVLSSDAVVVEGADKLTDGAKVILASASPRRSSS